MKTASGRCTHFSRKCPRQTGWSVAREVFANFPRNKLSQDGHLEQNELEIFTALKGAPFQIILPSKWMIFLSRGWKNKRNSSVALCWTLLNQFGMESIYAARTLAYSDKTSFNKSTKVSTYCFMLRCLCRLGYTLFVFTIRIEFVWVGVTRNYICAYF